MRKRRGINPKRTVEPNDVHERRVHEAIQRRVGLYPIAKPPVRVQFEMRIGIHADSRELDFLLSLSARCQQRTKMKHKERKNNYAKQIQNT
jgi:hypothetical protein